jgi:hypothetical protein
MATGAFLLFLLLALVPSTFAQGIGTISGYVRDPSGAVVTGASVTAVMNEQHTTRTVVTDAQGFYNFLALLPAHYTLTFEAPGFQRQVQSDVELTVSQNLRSDAQLKIGQVQTEVNVTSAATLVDTTSSTLSGLVDDNRMVDLPLNGRNVMSLAALLPGVTNVSAPEVLSDSRQGPEMDVNGGLPNATVYTFDGAYFENPSRNTGLNLPPPDAIAQFRMLTTNFAAEYGHSSGAQIEVVSKSGSNQFHGAAWEFWRNSDMNAKDYFATSVPFQNQNQFGGAFGGPIFKNKLFFFGSYEGLTDHYDVPPNEAFVPGSAERGGNFQGDLALSTPIVLTDPIDPLTNLPLTDPTNGNAPCVANNIISSGCISQVATNLLKFIPTPAGTVATTAPLVSPAPSPFNVNTVNVRIDWNQSAKNLVFGHYYQENTKNTAPESGWNNGNIPGYVGQVNTVGAYDGVVNDIYTFTPRIINRATFSILNSASNLGVSNTYTPASLGINMPQYTPAGSVAVIVQGNFVMDSNAPVTFSGYNYQFSDDLSWIKGKHSLKFGYEILKLHFYQAWMGSSAFTFDGSRTGDPEADFMMGTFGNAPGLGGMFGEVINDDHSAFNSFYAQDDYRVKPRLVLNYGLRWEPYLQWKDGRGELNTIVPNAQSTVDPSAPPGVLYPGDKGIDKGIAPANLSNFAPRVGFAWDVFGDGKTSIRGGFGVFYNSINANEFAVQNPPYGGSFSRNDGNIDAPFVSTGTTAPPVTPTGKFGCTPSATYPYYSCSLFPLPIDSMLGISTKLRLPYYEEYDFSIQRQITPTTVIEASYVGNHGYKIHGRIPFNPAVYETDPITNQAPSASNENDRTIYEPGILDPTNRIMENFTHSDYNSLQIQGTKRFGHGSSVLANYTRAKSLALNSSNNNNANIPDPFNLQQGFGPASFDRRNSFMASWLYSIPVHLPNHLANNMLGGWIVSAIHTVSSGLPINFYAGQDVALNGTGESQYAQLQSGANASTIKRSHSSRADEVNEFFNTTAFVPPSQEVPGTYGNAGTGMIYGPAYANTDASVLKDFTLLNQLKLQFRAEAFNVFNEVNFSNPNATNPSSSGFGVIGSTVAGTGRQLQLALKLHW